MQAVTSFILVLCMFRFWGDEAYGIYAYYVSVITIALVIAEYGTPNIFRREFQGDERDHLVYNHFFALRLATAILCAAVLFIFYLKHESLFFIYYMAIALLSTFRLNEYVLEVKFKNATVTKVKTSVYLLGMVAKIIVVVTHGSVEQIALVSLFERLVLTSLFCWLGGIRFVATQVDPAFFRSIVKSSTMMALSFAVTVLSGRIYVFILYEVLGEAAVGQYSICNRIIEMLLLPTQVGFSVLVPLLVALQRTGNSGDFYRKIMNCAFYLYLIGAGVFIAVQKPLMHTLFSERFTEFGLLMSLMVLLPLIALNSLANVYYVSHHHDRVIFFRNLLFLVFSVVFGSMLVSAYGLHGIAPSILATFVAMEGTMSLSSASARNELCLRLRAMVGLGGLKRSVLDVYRQKVNLADTRETSAKESS